MSNFDLNLSLKYQNANAELPRQSYGIVKILLTIFASTLLSLGFSTTVVEKSLDTQSSSPYIRRENTTDGKPSSITLPKLHKGDKPRNAKRQSISQPHQSSNNNNTAIASGNGAIAIVITYNSLQIQTSETHFPPLNPSNKKE